MAEDSHAARSHAISLRIQELSLAGALAYPRIQSCGGHMRIPAFRAKYKDVSLDSPGQEEVVLRGMQNHNLYGRRAHDMQDDSNPSAVRAPSWYFWT